MGGEGGFMMSLAGERRLHKYTPPFLTGAQPGGRGEGALHFTQDKIVFFVFGSVRWDEK